MKIGICGCGCGRKTELATETRPRRGWINGKPKPFLPHHSKFRNVSKDGVFKNCARCFRQKRIYEFYREEASPDGRQRICKSCSAKQAVAYRHTSKGRAAKQKGSIKFNLRGHYGLTYDAYMAMHAAQSGQCAICQQPETTSRLGTTRRLGVDHNHTTGKLRGLLCIRCNNGVGYFRDDPKRLKAAIAYLRKYQ